MKYSELPSFLFWLRVFNQKITSYFFHRRKNNCFLVGPVVLALFACFWVTTASAVVPIKIVGYSWPKEFEPKKTLPEVRRNTMRPAAEQACRELALPSVIASTPSLARAELLGLAVTGNSTDLQCTMTFGSVADLGLASVGYRKAFDQRIFEIRDCPANATASGKLGDANRTCQCDRGFQEDPTHSACHKAKENTCENDQKKGNPILPGTAEKFRAEDDILEGGPSPLNFGRIYRSTWASSAIYSDATPSSMGGGWRHSHAMSLEATPANAPSNVVVTTADGSERHFSRAAGAASWTAYNSTDRLVQMGNDDWMYTRTDDDVTFTFDKVGRLLSRTERNGWITRYTYDKAGQLTTITNPFGRSLRLAYDTGGRVASVTMPDARTVSYGYDVEKRLTSVRYVYDEAGTLMGEYGAGGAKSASSRQYLWLPTPSGPMPIATVENATTLQAITADHLNTPRRVTSADGALLWQWPYSAFGEDPPTIAARKFANVAAAEGEYEFNLRYPGQYFDKESGLHYNGFRTYDPLTGRYTQSDPIGLSGGWNRFGYVGGNALFAVDPNGLQASQMAGRYGAIGGNSGSGGSRGGYDARTDTFTPGSPSALERLANGVAKQCKAVRDWMFSDGTNSAEGGERVRGLPPDGVTPPVDGEIKPGPASRPSERDKGGQSLWDDKGGEWRYSPEDKWHNPHWDYNPNDRTSSPWQNVPIGSLPPRK